MGEVLKCYRLILNITNSEAAKKIGISSSHLCDLEANRRNVSLDTLEKISLAYEIPTSKIMYFYELKTKQNIDRLHLLKEMLEYWFSIHENQLDSNLDGKLNR